MKECLVTKLENLTHEQLCALVVSVYGTDIQVDRSIEAGLLARDPTALSKHLKKQIQSISRGRRFIDYHESSTFSFELDQLLNEIRKLLPNDPKAAFVLSDQFMAMHGKVLDRCDDSNGSVGESFYVGRELWLEAAAAWRASDQPCDIIWTDELRKRHENNEYGIWDFLFAGSRPLLGEQTLREIALEFEEDIARLSKKKKGSYNHELAVAEIGLRGVAEALADVEMYARSYTLNRPEPNELQKEQIAKFCLELEDGESALQWLAGEWQPRFLDRQQRLLDGAYCFAGREADLLALRKERYRLEPSFGNLQALLSILPKAERNELQSSASIHASASEDIGVAVSTLLQLQDMDAVSAYVLKHPDKLQDVGYYTLSDWAKTFEKNRLSLPAVLSYRVLLLDILEAGRSKAYRYAARYHTALERLDSHINDYKTWPDKSGFNKGLMEKHGRKRSFWALVGSC